MSELDRLDVSLFQTVLPAALGSVETPVERSADDHLGPLLACRTAAETYQLRSELMKPCIAALLEGQFGDGGRHQWAFVLAMELRGNHELGEREVEMRLRQWASRWEIPQRYVNDAIKSAFKKDKGLFKYKPPGLLKGTTYRQVLQPTCDTVGCPANCPAFSKKYAGLPTETFEKFERMGWPAWLKRQRFRTAIDVYQGICLRERQLALTNGVDLFINYRQIADLGGCSAGSVRSSLEVLAGLGLIEFKTGEKRSQGFKGKATEVKRVIPIPPVPRVPTSYTPITTGFRD